MTPEQFQRIADNAKPWLGYRIRNLFDRCELALQHISDRPDIRRLLTEIKTLLSTGPTP